MTSYRADVDGLRAVAILTVVAYHVGVPGFAGGFTGVDVFFVLSGYLITSILWSELRATGRIDWRVFYARRARRLLPALAVTALLALVVGMVVLPPDPDLRWLSQSVVGAAGFVSNVFFWLKTGGYFGATADTLPLLHTWSLAVEEQFYLVWPVVLLVAWRLGRRGGASRLLATCGLAALAVGSFGAAVALPDRSAAFYLMPTRLWELAAGAAVAIAGSRLSAATRGANRSLGFAGLLLVLAPVPFAYSARWFPGWGALPSVIGTVALLLSGRAPNVHAVNGAMSSRALVFIGKRSYSWYLLHWPLLVFVRTVTFSHSVPRDLGIALAAFVAACGLHRWIEQPWREGRTLWTRTTSRALLSGLAIIGVLGATGALVLRDTAAASMLDLTPSQAAALAENRRAWDTCPNRGATTADGVGVVDCTFDAERPTRLVLIGDSHAFGLTPAMQLAARELGWGLDVIWTPGCPFIVGYQPPEGDRRLDAACERENTHAAALLHHQAAHIGGIVTTNRSSGIIGEASQQALDRWATALGDTLARIESDGTPVVLMHDVPHFSQPVAQCVIRKGTSGCDIATDEARRDRQPVMDAETKAVLQSGVPVATWDPFDALCDDDVCHAVSEGEVLFRDRTHLSKAGAMHLATTLVPWLVATLRAAG